MKRFQYHINTAHRLWEEHVRPGDIVIDATCGNGNDTLQLAQLALTAHSGTLYAMDIQLEALEKAQHYLQELISLEEFSRIKFVEGCHSQFPKEIQPDSVKLIVYNLGYLPGGDKSVTTRVESTKRSLLNAMELIQVDGLICVTCYPGHAEGEREQSELIEFVSTLDSQKWECSHQRWLNRPKSPTLLLMRCLGL